MYTAVQHSLYDLHAGICLFYLFLQPIVISQTVV